MTSRDRQVIYQTWIAACYFRPMFDLYAGARRVAVEGAELTVADHGPADGVGVLMIHGFPDSARLWRHQIPVLTQGGYRVLAPDVKGYGMSDKPADVGEYAVAKLGEDMVGILDDAGVDQAHVVGHDWGAGIAWYLAIARPDRVRTLTALSVGHPTAFRRAGLPQLEKSWYTLLFQFEGVAERWLSQNDWQGMRQWIGRHPEFDHWVEDLSRPDALTAALAPYRANMGPERLLSPPADLPPVQSPVMGVWSSGDLALLESQMKESGRFVAGEWRYERIDGVSHWIPLDAPDELNALLLDWFGQH